MKNFYKTDIFTSSIFIIIVLMFIHNFFINGTDAVTGISGQQIIDAGGMSKDSSIISIITSLFVHQSLYHFTINLVMFYFLGRLVHENLGSFMYVFGFIVSGIIGNIFTLNELGNGTACGVSGCIFGLMGMLLVASFTKVQKFKTLHEIRFIVLFAVIVSVIYTIIGVIQSTNIYAHFIGLIVGALISVIYILILKLKKDVVFSERSKKY
jgi:rhomboid protease GluP